MFDMMMLTSDESRVANDPVAQDPASDYSLSFARGPGLGPASVRLARRAGRWGLECCPGVGAPLEYSIEYAIINAI